MTLRDALAQLRGQAANLERLFTPASNRRMAHLVIDLIERALYRWYEVRQDDLRAQTVYRDHYNNIHEFRRRLQTNNVLELWRIRNEVLEWRVEFFDDSKEDAQYLTGELSDLRAFVVGLQPVPEGLLREPLPSHEPLAPSSRNQPQWTEPQPIIPHSQSYRFPSSSATRSQTRLDGPEAHAPARPTHPSTGSYQMPELSPAPRPRRASEAPAPRRGTRGSRVPSSILGPPFYERPQPAVNPGTFQSTHHAQQPSYSDISHPSLDPARSHLVFPPQPVPPPGYAQFQQAQRFQGPSAQPERAPGVSRQPQDLSGYAQRRHGLIPAATTSMVHLPSSSQPMSYDQALAMDLQQEEYDREGLEDEATRRRKAKGKGRADGKQFDWHGYRWGGPPPGPGSGSAGGSGFAHT